MKTNWSIFFIILVVSISACKRDVAPASDATITFIEPAVGDTIALGEELHAEGMVEGNGEMHGYQLIFTNQTNQTTVLNLSSDTHAETYSFHEHWVNNVSDTSIIDVKIIVELDHDGNTKEKAVQIVCLP